MNNRESLVAVHTGILQKGREGVVLSTLRDDK